MIVRRKITAAHVTDIHRQPSLTAMKVAMLVVAVLIFATMQPGIAHDGPESVIESLNATMLKTGPTADLLFRRATEFRAMRDDLQAAADLQRAIHLDGSLEIARLELARLQLTLEKAAAASGQAGSAAGEPLETLDPLISSQDESIKIAALALRGEIHLSYCQWAAAVADFTSALAKRPDEIEWVLWLATAQQENGHQAASLIGLRKSFDTTQSPVVRAVWCDTLIETARLNSETHSVLSASLLREAEEIIDDELRDSRLKSAWLIRRALVLLLNNKPDAAKQDLDSALAELNIRLATHRPDPVLVKDRERVQLLLK